MKHFMLPIKEIKFEYLSAVSCCAQSHSLGLNAGLKWYTLLLFNKYLPTCSVVCRFKSEAGFQI